MGQTNNRCLLIRCTEKSLFLLWFAASSIELEFNYKETFDKPELSNILQNNWRVTLNVNTMKHKGYEVGHPWKR